MSTDSMHAVFNWLFVTAMLSASVAVIAVANTLGCLGAADALGKMKVSRMWAAFIAALALTVYAAYLGGWSWQLGRILEVIAYAIILFAVAAGVHQSVLAISRRFAAAGRTAGTSASGGWWESWF